MNAGWLRGLVVILLLPLSVWCHGQPRDKQLSHENAKVVLRQIGHQLRLKSSDTSTVVVPVTQISTAVFELRFDSPFSFMPDTLVSVMRRDLAMAGVPSEYRVSIYDCETSDIIYSFEIKKEKNNITTCLGCVQRPGCYVLQIVFLDFHVEPPAGYQYYYYVVAGVGLSIFILLSVAFFIKDERQVVVSSERVIRIGTYELVRDERLLRWPAGTVVLTNSETALLSTLASAPDVSVGVGQLMTEVSSEDTFSSHDVDVVAAKLSRKLAGLPGIKLVGIGRKSYKLTVH